MIVLSRETSEYLIPTMFLEGVAVEDFDVAICKDRPTVWVANPGPRIDNFDRGLYKAYGRCVRDGQTYVRRLDAPNDNSPPGLQIA